jgi:hypothetical protein
MVLYRSIVQIGRSPSMSKNKLTMIRGRTKYMHANQHFVDEFELTFSFSFSWHKLKMQEFELPCVLVSKLHNISFVGESCIK